MPLVVTALHDPIALAATCRRLGLDSPAYREVRLGGHTASGWAVHLPGLHAPIVCDTLRGLVAYHPRDNTHDRYARLMRFIRMFYNVRAERRLGGEPAPAEGVPAGDVAQPDHAA
jgi:hypothetical protein